MRTEESMQRVKLETRMPCSHALWFSSCWDDQVLRAPRSWNATGLVLP